MFKNIRTCSKMYTNVVYVMLLKNMFKISSVLNSKIFKKIVKKFHKFLRLTKNYQKCTIMRDSVDKYTKMFKNVKL